MRGRCVIRLAVTAFLIISFAHGVSPRLSRAEPAQAEKTNPVALEYRIWSSADGTKKQEAAFLRMEDGVVFVQRKDGSVGKIPVAALSPADQLFIGQETARRRAETKKEDLFTDADDSFGPGESIPLPAITPRDGETNEAFTERHAEHLAKQRKLVDVTRGLGGLADQLEGKGRELRHKHGKKNPIVLATTLSGDLLRMNDQRRNAIDKELSAFRSGEAAAARTDKASAVTSEIIATQTRLLDEAASKSDADVRLTHSEYLKEFQESITQGSSNEEVDAVLAGMRSRYQKLCDAELESFKKRRSLAAQALRVAAEEAVKARKRWLEAVVTDIGELAKDFDTVAVPLEQNPRIRNLKPPADPNTWAAGLQSEAAKLAERYEVLRLRLQSEKDAVVRNLESNWPQDQSLANLDTFRQQQVTQFVGTLKDTCKMADAACSDAVRRVVAQYDPLKGDERTGSGAEDLAKSDSLTVPPDRSADEDAEVAGKSAVLPTSEPQPNRAVDAVGHFFSAEPDAVADRFVDLLLGETSGHYNEHGYKGVLLGQTFKEISEQGQLKNLGDQTGRPFVYERPQAGESFIFDQDERLVCYGRRYEGGAEDYKEELIDLFGRPLERRIKQRDVTGIRSAARMTYTTMDFTFRSVLVRVVFDDQQFPQGDVLQLTHVFVVDRNWAEPILLRSATAKIKAVRWLREAAEFLAGDLKDRDSVPQIEGTEVEFVTDGVEEVAYGDKKREEQLRSLWGGDSKSLATCAGIRKPQHGGSPTAHFNCFRCSSTRMNVTLKEEPFPRGLLPDSVENVQNAPILNDWLWDLNQIMLEEAFPPVGGQVTRMRKPDLVKMSEWLEWTYVGDGGDKWVIVCGKDQLMRCAHSTTTPGRRCEALAEPISGYLRPALRRARLVTLASARAARSSARYTRTASGWDSFQTSGRRA